MGVFSNNRHSMQVKWNQAVSQWHPMLRHFMRISSLLPFSVRYLSTVILKAITKLRNHVVVWPMRVSLTTEFNHFVPANCYSAFQFQEALVDTKSHTLCCKCCSSQSLFSIWHKVFRLLVSWISLVTNKVISKNNLC